MLEEVCLTVEQQLLLKEAQSKASSSIGEVIRAGAVFTSPAFAARVTATKTRMMKMMPSDCPIKDRLAQTYAVDMVSTFVVSYKKHCNFLFGSKPKGP